MELAAACRTMQQQMGKLYACIDIGTYFQPHYRIRTPYLYPDGDTIDLFCKTDGQSIVVTDEAETTGWLYMKSEDAELLREQNTLIQKICRMHEVEFKNGAIKDRCDSQEDLATTVNRVAQAALRISDLSYTQTNSYPK